MMTESLSAVVRWDDATGDVTLRASQTMVGIPVVSPGDADAVGRVSADELLCAAIAVSFARALGDALRQEGRPARFDVQAEGTLSAGRQAFTLVVEPGPDLPGDVVDTCLNDAKANASVYGALHPAVPVSARLGHVQRDELPEVVD